MQLSEVQTHQTHRGNMFDSAATIRRQTCSVYTKQKKDIASVLPVDGTAALAGKRKRDPPLEPLGGAGATSCNTPGIRADCHTTIKSILGQRTYILCGWTAAKYQGDPSSYWGSALSVNKSRSSREVN